MTIIKTVKWIVLGVLLIVWIVLSILLCKSDLDLWAKSIATLGVLFTVLWSTLNSVESTATQMKLSKMKKKELSLCYARRWEDESLIKARNLTREIRDNRSKICDDDLIKRFNFDQDLKRSVLTMFNFFEEMYTAISNDLADKEILRDLFSEIYCGENGIYKRFECLMTYPKMKKHLEKLFLIMETGNFRNNQR